MKKRLLALAIGLLVGVALAEGIARLLVPGGAADALFARMGDRVDDPVLEHRGRPGTGENDAGGYRNPQRLEQADVVALGDSQTWGVNAAMEETWPSVLARSSGLSVYNMGRGGYGMLQYLHLVDAALGLEPRWVVVAIYLGNDLHDARALAYGLDAHAEWRSQDPEVQRQLASPSGPDPQQMFFARVAYQRAQAGPLQWLAENTALGRLAARVRTTPADMEADRAWAADHPDEGFVYDDGRRSTVFHASYRLAAVDTSRPGIREGLRITREALGELAARVDLVPDTRLVVLLLPTKERAYSQAVAASGGTVPASYSRALVEEARVARQLTSFMAERSISLLDLLAPLERAIARGEGVFPPNADGHFTAAGYQVIGEAVASFLASAPPL